MKNWLDEYLNNFSMTDPKNLPATPEKTPSLDAYNSNLDFLGIGLPKEEEEDLPTPTQPVSKPLNPAIVKHLMSKKEGNKENIDRSIDSINDEILPERDLGKPGILDKFSTEAYTKAKTEADERNSDLGWAQFAAGVGNSLARRDPGEVNSTFDKIRERNKDETIGEFNRQKASAISDIDVKNKTDLNDPNSQKSKLLQSVVAKYYPNAFSKEEILTLTAADQDAVMKPLELKAKIDARKDEVTQLNANRALQREMMTSNRNEVLQEKRDQKAKLSDKQIESFSDIDNAKSDLKNILGQLSKNSEWTGPVDGRVPNMLVGQDQVAWRSAVGKYKDAYRKAVTGAGASASEIAMLESRLPSETDTYENFKAKAEEAEKELQRRKSVMTSNLSKAGKNVEGFSSLSKPSEDDKAIAWAKKNSSDPRAKKILELHGVK